MTTVEVSMIISCVMMVIAVLTFAFSRSTDHGKREYWQGQTTNMLSGIADDIKDMKAEQRLTDQRITKVQEVAAHALDRAEAAHARIDRAGIDQRND